MTLIPNTETDTNKDEIYSVGEEMLIYSLSVSLKRQWFQITHTLHSLPGQEVDYCEDVSLVLF